MTYAEFVADYPYIAAILRTILIFGLVMQIVPLLVYVERKVCAYIQDRIGPNRVGPIGLLQPLADVIKLALKEDITPRGIDRAIYTLGPLIVYLPAMLAFAVVPIGIDLQIADLSVGIVYLLTVASLGVYGLSFGGWASNNKYSLLGGLRSSAQMISYEVALGLSVLCVIMMSSSLDLNQMIRDQHAGGWFGWNVFQQPLLAILFFTAAFAETNRLPFDLAECEAELVGGFHTEYSSLKFAMFFMGEYIAIITMSSLMVTFFLGGWTVPWWDIPVNPGWLDILFSFAIYMVKLTALLFFFVWVRWTLPRFRYDQLMHLGWKCMIPLNLVLVATTASMIILDVRSYLPAANIVLIAIVAVIATSRHAKAMGQRQEAARRHMAGEDVHGAAGAAGLLRR